MALVLELKEPRPPIDDRWFANEELPISYQGAAPAAGVLPTYYIPVDTLLLLQSVSVKLVCSSSVANRRLSLQVLDRSGNLVWGMPDNTAKTASSTTIIQWGTNAGPTGISNGIETSWLPHDPRVISEWSLGFLQSGLQTGDQLSAIEVYAIDYSARLRKSLRSST
jgi:hypothetical protein